MTVTKTWNAGIDADEFEVTMPTSSDELADLEFPASALQWLNDPISMAKRPIVVEALDSKVLSCCEAGDVSYFKLEPEDTDFDSSFFVCFGRSKNKRECVSIRLDLPRSDWEAIEATLGFPACPTFKAFAERCPGLTIGALGFPPYLLPPDLWTNTEMLVGRDGQGRFLISDDLLSRLREFLIFQVDYWAKAKLLDNARQVWAYDLSAKTLEATGKSFEEWLAEESWDCGNKSS